jgi:hypothetical protein
MRKRRCLELRVEKRTEFLPAIASGDVHHQEVAFGPGLEVLEDVAVMAFISIDIQPFVSCR